MGADARFPTDPNDPSGVPFVLRTGEPELHPEIPAHLLDEAAVATARAEGGTRRARPDFGDDRADRCTRPHAWRDSFFWAESGRRYTEADLELALDLARRAGIAVDNAQLFREAEERAQAARVLASVGDGVLLVDAAGVSATGIARPRRSPGCPARPFSTAAPPRRSPAGTRSCSACRSRSTPSRLRERIRCRSGVGDRELWLSVTGVAVADGTVYAFRDLTEERALDDAEAEFVSTVSHELRTPLAAIYGAAMTLRREDVVLDDEQNMTLLNVITNESDRLARTVNAILWASRLDTDALATTIETLRSARARPGRGRRAADPSSAHLRLELVPPDGLPPVAADPDKVRQVLVNLVDNAVKYSPDGGEVRLEISSEARPRALRRPDQGLGIPHAEQRRIFDKFYRLDPP